MIQFGFRARLSYTWRADGCHNWLVFHINSRLFKGTSRGAGKKNSQKSVSIFPLLPYFTHYHAFSWGSVSSTLTFDSNSCWFGIHHQFHPGPTPGPPGTVLSQQLLLSTVGIIRQGNDLANRCHGFSLAIHRSEKLVGGFNPLKNDGVSWDDVYSQYMGKW